MQKANLILPPAEKLTIADFAARFLMTKPLPNMGLYEPLSKPGVRDAIEANLVPLPLDAKPKPVEEMNLLEVIGVAKSDDETRKALNGVLVDFGKRRVAATDGRRLLYLDNAPQEFIDFIRDEFKRIHPELAEREMVDRTWDWKKKMVIKKAMKVKATECILRNATKEVRKLNPAQLEQEAGKYLQYKGEYYDFVDRAFPNYEAVIPEKGTSRTARIPDIWGMRGWRG